METFCQGHDIQNRNELLLLGVMSKGTARSDNPPTLPFSPQNCVYFSSLYT